MVVNCKYLQMLRVAPQHLLIKELMMKTFKQQYLSKRSKVVGGSTNKHVNNLRASMVRAMVYSDLWADNEDKTMLNALTENLKYDWDYRLVTMVAMAQLNELKCNEGRVITEYAAYIYNRLVDRD